MKKKTQTQEIDFYYRQPFFRKSWNQDENNDDVRKKFVERYQHYNMRDGRPYLCACEREK
jgi:hypothetical protein